jgi:hypothetical protein
VLVIVKEFVDTLRDRVRRQIWTEDRALGRRGEDRAQRAGFTIVARN